jgi:hypothetical protein
MPYQKPRRLESTGSTGAFSRGIFDSKGQAVNKKDRGKSHSSLVITGEKDTKCPVKGGVTLIFAFSAGYK